MNVRRFLSVLTLVALALPAAAAQEASALPSPGKCVEGDLPEGAKSLICIPASGWNGSLVVFAHGYVAPEPFEPLQFANLQFPDGQYLPDLIQQLGFAFATTTYRRNGLAILEGTEDVVNLVQEFERRHGAPRRTYLAGASEGGLVTSLAAELYPSYFTAAYALCGPIGNFRLQVNYLGDFRVLFDYFFPNVIPGSPVDVPAQVQGGWLGTYVPAITAAVTANPSRARELLRVARAPFDPRDPASILQTTVGLLWYNVFATNDARATLGGNPFDNRFRWYWGSSNDLLLNLKVPRFSADAGAVARMAAYSPTGDLRVPMVSLHTTGDEIVPYAHELIYGAIVRPSERGRFVPLPVLRYGHCAFKTSEVLAGFALMLIQ